MACILVVDDFEDTRSLYAAFLRSRGHQVFDAGDGEAALRIAGPELPDVIVMDLSLPILDGGHDTLPNADREARRAFTAVRVRARRLTTDPHPV